MQQAIDAIIDILNNQDAPVVEQLIKNKPLEKQILQPQIEIQGDNQIDQMNNFQQIYQQRMQKVEYKNNKKNEEKKKKQQTQLKIKNSLNASKKVQESKQPLKLATIRSLVFRSWSGNHLNYQLNDNGYKFRFTNGVVALIKHLLEQNGFIQATNNEGILLWNNGVIVPSTYQGLGAYQKINHFPKTYECTRKDLMLQNLSKIKSKHSNHYNFYPQTYILPAESTLFMQNSEQCGKYNKCYIVKPSNKSQGRGIWISNSPEQILKKQKQCMVVSEYINNPFLINNLKFDIRLYVAITCFNPLRIYLFEDGLTRFATAQYEQNLNAQDNLFAHLTNYSLNKYAENFIPNDDEDQFKGHKWSLNAFKNYLQQNNYDVNLLWSRIEDLIIKTIISIETTVFHAIQMQVPYRDNCFQVLGFDVLIDDNLRPWLIEINLSPSLNTDSPLDLKIKGNMIADLLTMIGIVSPEQRFSIDKSYLLNANKGNLNSNQYARLQKMVLKESQQQNKRSGGWKIIYPTETAIRYKPMFDIDRPFNRLLRENELTKIKNNKDIGYNYFIKNIMENPQNEKKKNMIKY